MGVTHSAVNHVMFHAAVQLKMQRGDLIFKTE